LTGSVDRPEFRPRLPFPTDPGKNRPQDVVDNPIVFASLPVQGKESEADLVPTEHAVDLPPEGKEGEIATPILVFAVKNKGEEHEFVVAPRFRLWKYVRSREVLLEAIG
jgi:hypothetical protein